MDCDFILATIKLDPHADAVIDELSQRGFSVFRLNTDGEDSEYQLSCTGGDLRPKDTFDRTFSTDHRKTVGYYRKPSKRDTSNGSKAERFIASETNGFFDGIFTHPKIEWVNPRYSILASQSKIGQHQVAKDLDFSVPETLITNVPDEARDFAKSIDWEIAIKPVATPSIPDAKDAKHFYTIRPPKEELMPLIERIGASPVILQRYVEKATELRVTIFGDTAFCCRFDSQKNADGATDWRAVEPTKISHDIVSLDENLKSKCLQMLKYYGLSFGTFDFVQRPSGETVFLELNPNGQWYWIELLTGAKMAAAMAEFLIKKLGTKS